MQGLAVLLLQGALYFSVMATLFRARRQLGIGVFICALGVMHFLETYLAAIFFIELPFGLISPGSTVMFAGKLAMILLLYIREDAETVRQPIYGLLVGNMLMVALAIVLRLYTPVNLAGHTPDLAFLDQLGALMVWGTLILFADSVGLILLYERLGRVAAGRPLIRCVAALAIILTFDQFAFYLGLHTITGAPPAALIGGLAAKMLAAVTYGVFITAYLRWAEPMALSARDGQPIADLFGKLTYRFRYETLLEKSGVDPLTGLFDRGRFEALAPARLSIALRDQRPLSVAVIDVDHFKHINDQHGHLAGDEVLRQIAATLRAAARPGDTLFRYGGEEFVILCEDLPHEAAIVHMDHLRQAVPLAMLDKKAASPTLSIGVASAPGDGTTMFDLLQHADQHMYAAKRAGRNRVMGNNSMISA